jgi:hypothetical protein
VVKIDWTVLADINETLFENLTEDIITLMVLIIPVLMVFGIFGKFKGWF